MKQMFENIKNVIHNYYYLLFHPIMLALFIFLIVLIVMPDYFTKYTAEVIECENHKKGIKEYYHDMNDDGVSEKLSFISKNNKTFAAVLCYDINDLIIDQCNFRGKWLFRSKVFFDDYDNNGFDEIYCFTSKHDSIFIHVVELMNKNGVNKYNKFVCKLGLLEDDDSDISIIDGKISDINSDGYGEFVFALYAGFSKKPRNIFAYYINKDSIAVSPLSASGFSREINFMDINNDGIEEVTGYIGAHDNYHDNVPYSDSSSWLMVINSKTMDFLFPPIKYDGGFGSAVKAFLCQIGGRKYIAAKYKGNKEDCVG